MTVDLRATGVSIKNVEGQPPGVDVGSIPLDCPSVDPTPRCSSSRRPTTHGVHDRPRRSRPPMA